MKSTPLVVGMPLLIALALGWFLGRREEAQTLLEQPQLEVSDASMDQKIREEGGEYRISPARSSTLDFEAQASGRVKESAEVASGDEAILVKVVRREDGGPVSGIDVFAYSYDTIKNAISTERMSYWDRVQRFGTQYCTDDRGLVRVKRQSKAFQLMALSSELFGSMDLDDDDSTVTVEVGPFPTVEVQVVDPDGEPVVGAAVVGRRYPGRANGDWRAIDVARAWTEAPSGKARLKILNSNERGRDDYDCVAIEGVFESPVEALIDFKNPPSKTLTLVLPTSGSIRVLVGNSEAVSQTVPATRVLVTLDIKPLPTFPFWDSAERTTLSFLDKGVAHSAPLRLGENWEVTVDPGPYSHFERLTQEVVGPKSEGEVVDVRFRIPDQPTRCVLRGRAIDESGKPFAEVTLMARGSVEKGSGSSRGNGQLTTAADGTFEVVFDVEESDADNPWTVEFILCDEHKPVGRFVTDLTDEGPGILDLGDMVFRPDPVLVTGKVLGPDGEGLPGVIVEVYDSLTDRCSPMSHAFVVSSSISTGADGAFEVRGDDELERLKLVARSPGFRHPGLDVRRGEKGVILRLTALGELRAKLVAGSDESSSFMDGLQYELQKNRRPSGQATWVKDDHLIQFFGEIGNYELFIWHESNPTRILYRSDLLLLEAGKTLDLGEIRIDSPGIQVEVVIEASLDELKSSRRGRVRFFPLGEKEPVQESEVSIPGNRTVLTYVPSLPIDVEVEVLGFRAQRWTMTKPKAKVVLKRGIEVKIELSGVENAPPDAEGDLVLAYGSSDLERLTIPHDVSDCRKSFVLQKAGATLLLTRPGIYKARVSLGFQSMIGSLQNGVPQEGSVEIHVLDQEGPQTFQIDLDPAQVEDAFNW